MENKKLYKIIISIGLLSFFFISCVLLYDHYKTYYSANTNFSDEAAFIYIKTGTDSNNLLTQITPFIKDSSTFFDAAYKTKYILNIKAGKYEIKKGFSNKEIINSLRFKNIPVKVTFNNIERIENLASRVSKYIEADSLSLMKSFYDKKFLKNNDLDTESVFSIFLPNTYEFYWNSDANEFRDKMLIQFNLFWNLSRKEKAKSLNLNPIQVSVLASIVQRETPKVDERPKISGVYYNRLKKRMKLQADPTVVYTIKEKKGFDIKIRRVLYRDLKIKSPYNTYISKGLPPGPIYMPDISSIESVLNLENHNYLFFVANVQRPGYHMFAKTLSQHNRNKRQYTSWLRKNKINR
ncbi:MAG: aminodeoxychorismate lyase [Flavobacteriaceae bacterium]|nr:aminodeoxychorismate lyase [Flavobacteriaceae bacterium]|tara:strand:+ start:2161 stop:3213 length:1053 start_codon:yes stop_codon:yes gene_type:complete